jgi:hypothetical protein
VTIKSTFQIIANAIFWVLFIWGVKTGNIGWALLAGFASALVLFLIFKFYYPEHFDTGPELYYPHTPITYRDLINQPCDKVWEVITDTSLETYWWRDFLSISPNWQRGAIIKWKDGGESKITSYWYGSKIVLSEVITSLTVRTYLRGKSTLVYIKLKPINGHKWGPSMGHEHFPEIIEALNRLKENCNG